MHQSPRGDLHRFGQFVEKRGPDSGPFLFAKPRSTHLEYLITDPRSPFAQTLATILAQAPRGSITCDSDWLGHAQDLSALVPAQPTQALLSEQYAESCGRWLAVATLLGLTDLHAENMLVLAGNDSKQAARFELHPIDLEIAFWKCVSGIDTLLIPSKLIPIADSGFLAQTGAKDFALSHPARALDGFFKAARLLVPLLGDLTRDLDRALASHPIRVLLRSTREYRKALQSREYSSFVPEEQLQLSAGDVPYFFVIRGEQDLKYFSAPGVISNVESIQQSGQGAGQFLPILKSATPSVAELVEQNWVNQLVKVTALHLVRGLETSWTPEQATQSGDDWTLTLSLPADGSRAGQMFGIECPEFRAGATFAKL